jgi:hypothetical protein
MPDHGRKAKVSRLKAKILSFILHRLSLLFCSGPHSFRGCGKLESQPPRREPVDANFLRHSLIFKFFGHQKSHTVFEEFSGMT